MIWSMREHMETKENQTTQGTSQNSPSKWEWIHKNIIDTLPFFYVTVFFLIHILGLGTFGSKIKSGMTFILNAISPSIAESDVWITGRYYFSFIGLWIVLLIVLAVFEKNHSILACVGPAAKGNNLIQLGIGLLIGFGMNAFCILIAWLNKDISLYFDSFRPISFILVFIMVFIQSSAEELACRGYLYQRLIKCYKKPPVAIIGNSLLFGLMHLMNDGVTIWSILSLVLMGILCSVVVYYRDSLWCAFAIHTAWNFAQNILFGLPNSGNVFPYSVFKLDAGSATDSFAYNVAFGVEGSILCCVVYLIVIAVLYFWYTKHPQ